MPDGFPIIDTHQHLWDLSQVCLPWLELKDVGPLNRSFLMSDYLAAVHGLNVVQTVYMEVNVHPEQQAQEAELAIELCARDDNPMAAAVIGGSPQDSGFADYIARFADNPYVKGVRTVLHDPDRPTGLCLQPQFVEGLRLLGDLDLCFDLCLRPSELDDGARLVELCPHTRFIVDHCGNMEVAAHDPKLRETWIRGMQRLAAHEHVFCKMSGIIVSATPGAWAPADLAPTVDFCLDTFGEDRVLFGGDWPVCTLCAPLREWVAALQEIVRDRTPEFRRKLFSENARAFYGL